MERGQSGLWGESILTGPNGSISEFGGYSDIEPGLRTGCLRVRALGGRVQPVLESDELIPDPMPSERYNSRHRAKSMIS